MYWLRERIHPMWHLAVLCYGVVIGVAAAQQVQADISGWIVVVITIIIGCAALKTRRRYALVLMAVVGVFAGLARGSADQSQLKLYEPLIGRQVVIVGTVKDDADTAVGGGLRLQIGSTSKIGRASCRERV